MAYTYTDAEITEDSDDGKFKSGDVLEYIPENQLSLSAGVLGQTWSSHVRANYVSSACTDTGCNGNGEDFDQTESLWVVDFVARKTVAQGTSVYFKLDNAFDERSIVARDSYGARGNRPRTSLVGVDYSF